MALNKLQTTLILRKKITPDVQVSPCRPIAEMPVGTLGKTAHPFIVTIALVGPGRLKLAVLVCLT